MKAKLPLVLVLTGAVLMLAALLTVAANDADLGEIDWGDAPTWVAGAIALLALIAAWRAGTIARNLLQVERLREDRAEKAAEERSAADERADQADRVAAWNNGDFTVRNGSELPIWDVRLAAIHPDRSLTYERSVGLIPPGQHQYPFREGRPPRDALGDGVGDEPWIIPDWASLVVEIRFRDAAGRRWERDRYGILRMTGRDHYLQVQGILANATFGAEAVVTNPDDPAGPEATPDGSAE